jgi:hypothetical protein
VSDVRARAGHLHRSSQRSPHAISQREVVRPSWDGDRPGGEVVALACALTLSVAAAETTLSGHLRLFFDLCFVAICLLTALTVRRRDFFTVGVMPPLLMAGTMVIVALNGPRVIAAAHDGMVQAVITGLARHSLALFAGYAVCLLTLLARQRLTR